MNFAGNGEPCRRAPLKQDGQRQQRKPLEALDISFGEVAHLAREATGRR